MATTRYAHRDRTGRFCALRPMAEVTTWHTAGEESHSHAGCGNLALAERRGAEVGTEADPSGWVCCSCTSVTTPKWDAIMASAKTAPVHGHKRCSCCQQVRQLRKFPTVEDSGVVGRAATCRQCRDAKREGTWQRAA